MVVDNNFFRLVTETVDTLEDLLGGHERSNVRVYREQCKAMVHEFVKVRNSLPALLPNAVRDGESVQRAVRELACLACQAVRLLESCSSPAGLPEWLHAVILTPSHRPKGSTFETLHLELVWCINILRVGIDFSTGDGLNHRDRVKVDKDHLRELLRNTVSDGASQMPEASIATFLLPHLEVNDGDAVDCRCIEQLNCWHAPPPETAPLIYMIEGRVVGPHRPFGDGEGVSVSKNLRWFRIRVAEKAFLNEDEDRRLWEKESRIMASLTHPNVASFIGCTDDPDGSPAIIMECEEQSLRQYVDLLQQQQGRDLQTPLEGRRRPRVLLELVDAVDILTQIASGFAYVHSQNVVHLDIKLENLVITFHTEHRFPRVKIIDFGHSMRLRPGSGKIRNPLPPHHGTTIYRAVELFQAGNMVCLRAADVCSFAFLAWALLHCHAPSLNVSLRPPAYYNALVSGHRLGFDHSIPLVLQNLVMRCWDTNPDARPPFSEIYLFLQSYKASLLGSQEPVVTLQDRTAQPRCGRSWWPRCLRLG